MTSLPRNGATLAQSGIPLLLPATPFAVPFAASFRGLNQREGVLIEGPAGWGEFAPFADYGPEQDARWLAAAIEAAVTPQALPEVVVPVNAILPDVPDTQLPSAVQELLTQTGCQVVKLKVGARPVAADIARVMAAAAAAADVVPGVHWRLDGNGLLDPQQAGELSRAIRSEQVVVDYFEQPCRTVAELEQFRTLDPEVQVAVDETIRRDRDFSAVAHVADVAVVKVAPLGGVRQAARVIAELPVAVVVSGAAESSVGATRDARLAATLPDTGLVHGLGTGTLLADDLATRPLLPKGGVVSALPVEVSPSALARAAGRLDADRQAQWRDRLDRAWRVCLEHDLIHHEDLATLGVTA